MTVAAKGGGSENKSKFVMLNPSDSIVDWVLKTVPTMGAGWCPPGMLGIGVGGTAEKAMLHGEGIADGADRHARAARARPAKQGGGTAHRAVREGQRARHRRAGSRRPHDRARREVEAVSDARRVEAGRDDSELRGDAPRAFRARWQRSRGARAAVARALAEGHVERGRRLAARGSRHAHARRSASWKPGETLLLNGKMLTGRDAAHKRIADLFASGAGPAAGRRFHEPRHLLRRPGRSGA